MILNKVSLITQISVKFFGLVICLVHLNSYGIEAAIQLHKTDQSGAYGVSLGVGDNFFNQREFNWAATYNHLENFRVNDLGDQSLVWDESDNSFPLDTVDFTLSYRYYPKSYNTLIKSLIVELQIGAGITLTENKFIFDNNPTEVFFSKQGDINAVLGLSVHKKMTKQMYLQIGLKTYPDYSEFGDVSSVFLGVSYQFGNKSGY